MSETSRIYSLPEDKLSTVSTGAQILIVDDDDMGRSAITRIMDGCKLENDNLEVCASVRDGIEKIMQGMAPDLILSEMLMSAETGLDFYKWLKQYRPELVRTLGFVTCGEGVNSQMRDFMDAMRTEKRLIDKPFLPNELIELVQRILGKGLII